MRTGQEIGICEPMGYGGEYKVEDKYVKQIGIRGHRSISVLDMNKGNDEKYKGMKNQSKLKRCDVGQRSFKEIIVLSQQVGQLGVDGEICKQGVLWVMKSKLEGLLDLYLQEEIIKHYCSRSDWKFDRDLIVTRILPALDLLCVGGKRFKCVFEPYLQKISQRYLLMSQLDIYSRMCSGDLLMSILQKWLRIRQGEIILKRLIRQNQGWFIRYFCNDDMKIDRKKIFDLLFRDSLDLKMVNVIKMCLFIFKVEGEDQEKNVGDWLQEF